MRRLLSTPRLYQLLLVILGLVLLVSSSAEALTYSKEIKQEGKPGESVQFWIDVTNNNNPPRIWVKIQEDDNDFKVIIRDSEEDIYISDTHRFFVEVEIPSDAQAGEYTIEILIMERQTEAEEYGGSQGTAFDLTVVTEASSSSTDSRVYLLGGLALTGLLIIVLEKKHYLLTAFGIIPAHWRLESEQVLDNDVRARVFEEVRKQDGVSLSQITKNASLSKSTVRYALRVLLAFNYIIQGPNRYYYLPGHSTSHLTHTQSTILDTMVTKESYRQEDLARAVGMTRAGLTPQLDTLIRRGDVERIKRGRHVYYRPSGRGGGQDDPGPSEHWWDKNNSEVA